MRPGFIGSRSRYAQFAAQIRNTLEAKLGFPPDTFKSLGSASGGSFPQILLQPAAAVCAVTIRRDVISDPCTLYGLRCSVIEYLTQ